MTMVSSGPISLGGNATTPATGTGTLSYSFNSDIHTTRVSSTYGFDPGLFAGQTITPASTTIGGGTAITNLSWNDLAANLTLTITGASNTGWNTLYINGTLLSRTAATFSTNTWTWPGIPNPFPATSTPLTVLFIGVSGITIYLNQSVERELYNTYGSLPGTAPITLNDAAVRTLAGIPSGPISLFDLYGKTAPFAYNYNLPSGSYDVDFNLTSKLYIAGWNGLAPIAAVITVGGVLGSSSAASYAFQTGSGYPAGSSIIVNVNLGGFITGAGGGVPTGLAGNGGSAMLLQTAITLNNTGVIQGGGGTGNYGDNSYNGAGCGYMVSNAGTIGTLPIGRVPKRGVTPYIVPISGFTSDPLGPVAGYDVNATGQVLSGSAQLYATVESGGSYSRDSAGGSNNGGSGGSWLAGTAQTTALGVYVYSPVLGGGGYGSSSPGSGEGTTNAVGIYGPGHSIDGLAFATGTIGTLRGPTT